MLWKDWSGYYAVRAYGPCHEREYFALRHAAGLIDVSPLMKYDIRGKEAGAFLAYLTVRDLRKLKVGRVTYLCRCDADGKVVDEGTVTRLEEDAYRLTANGPMLGWLHDHAHGFQVNIEDSSTRLGVLALQGPRAREILSGAVDEDIAGLRYFAWQDARIGDVPVMVSRTGYTGDLGYEIWMDSEQALPVWDALMSAGAAHRLLPAGLDAMDMTRLEAGFILNGVDYFSSHHCLIESRKSTPFEIGLGWSVKLQREPFLGQQALRKEKDEGSRWALVGLEYDWDEFEALFNGVGLPPQLPSGAWRDAVPVYDDRGRQVGQATSGAWSPLLKKNLALATVPAERSAVGSTLKIEVSVEFQRKQVTAHVVNKPFFDPERKRA
jgi:aminomethyltransferase